MHVFYGFYFYFLLLLGAVPAVSARPPCFRRTNSAPELFHIPSSRSSTPYSDMESPPPELFERRRGSLQDYNDVFLSYVPYIATGIGPTAAVIHLALDIAQRLSSS